MSEQNKDNSKQEVKAKNIEKKAIAVKPIENKNQASALAPVKKTGKSLYAKKAGERKSGGRGARREKEKDEFDQKLIDLARVTRVMAGGKRMKFRACIAIGDGKGRFGVGIAKGSDVTIAIAKAVDQAKKDLIKVPLTKDGSIPHEVRQKFGAAKILLRPARAGHGVIAGGAVRIALELAGIKNITSKIFGTSNKVNNAKCTAEALRSLERESL